MAQALLGGLLPAVFSGADQLKRGVYGLLTNPQEQAERAAQSLLQSRAERQALMARTFANPERPFQVTDQAGLSQLGTDVLTGELGIAPVGMIAYHGTPNLIQGKFDINKVGTGEGNQTYGYGMYFAEAPEVAKNYATMYHKDYFDKNKGVEQTASHYWNMYKTPEKAIEALKAQIKPNLTPEAKKFTEDAISVLESKKDKIGNFYKVDIPDEYIPKMLDWDKPLTEQPKQVQEALKKLGIETDINKLNEYDDALLKSLFEDSNIALPKQPINPTGQEIYERFIQGNPKYTAEKLKEVGITGIRYLDGFSRGKSGTSNFVVFDPTDVKILERNNQPVEGLLD
jgi:hypothetical protein